MNIAFTPGGNPVISRGIFHFIWYLGVNFVCKAQYNYRFIGSQELGLLLASNFLSSTFNLFMLSYAGVFTYAVDLKSFYFTEFATYSANSYISNILIYSEPNSFITSNFQFCNIFFCQPSFFRGSVIKNTIKNIDTAPHGCSVF